MVARPGSAGRLYDPGQQCEHDDHQSSAGGIGNLAHLSFEPLGATIGARMAHVPYAGAAPAQAALLSGQVDAAFDAPNAFSLIQSAKLKALAASTTVRWRDAPDVPAVAESGYPSFATSF